MNRLLPILGAAMAMLLSLGACANRDMTPADLPLADDKPTFLYFYTDN